MAPDNDTARLLRAAVLLAFKLGAMPASLGVLGIDPGALASMRAGDEELDAAWLRAEADMAEGRVTWRSAIAATEARMRLDLVRSGKMPEALDPSFHLPEPAPPLPPPTMPRAPRRGRRRHVPQALSRVIAPPAPPDRGGR